MPVPESDPGSLAHAFWFFVTVCLSAAVVVAITVVWKGLLKG